RRDPGLAGGCAALLEGAAGCPGERAARNAGQEQEKVMNDYGVVLDASTVRFERVLPGPIERVWEFLTGPVQRAKWFAGGPMEPRVGGKLELHFKHRNLMSVDEPVPEKY